MAASAASTRVTGLPAELAHAGRTLVMGVLNVTPDSFSDGGRYADAEDAVRHGIELIAQGADLIDVGGESTRPGASRLGTEEEQRRVLPVVSALAQQGVRVSIDTMWSSTARAAVDAGACMVNDVSGGLADEAMLPTIAELSVPCVLMHWRGHSLDMERLAHYEDVVGDVCAELRARLDAAVAAGVDLDRIVLDPGLGFAKEADHNWRLLAGMDALAELGRPLLIGASRKRFLGSLLGESGEQPRPVDQRDAATDAITAIASMAGAWAVRVHDVRGSADAVRVAAAWLSASREST